MKRCPLPQVIDLGFHLIHVRLLTKTEMRAETEDDATPGEFLVPEGFWDVDTDTIAIGKWLSRSKQRYVLCHELVHAALDLRDQV